MRTTELTLQALHLTLELVDTSISAIITPLRWTTRRSWLEHFKRDLEHLASQLMNAPRRHPQRLCALDEPSLPLEDLEEDRQPLLRDPRGRESIHQLRSQGRTAPPRAHHAFVAFGLRRLHARRGAPTRAIDKGFDERSALAGLFAARDRALLASGREGPAGRARHGLRTPSAHDAQSARDEHPLGLRLSGSFAERDERARPPLILRRRRGIFDPRRRRLRR